jgi:ubiquinone/menaquinone biosynthesis C-methylase UbiE
MQAKTVFRLGGSTVLLAGAYWIWQRARDQDAVQPTVSTDSSQQLLERAAPFLRLPTSSNQPPEVLDDGRGLRCPATGRVYPYRDGVLDLLPEPVSLTETQHVLNTRATAWAYDRFRGALMRVFGQLDFPTEVASIQQRLEARPGDRILDLACGHGNFTAEWAKRVGPNGLIIGLDISAAMLARASARVRAWGLDNVLLIRGDAHQLPLADACLPKVNCSGGFHQLPDLPRALHEIARVSAAGAVLTASTFAEGPSDQFSSLKRWLKWRFALHFVPLDWLGEQLSTAGYQGYQWSLPGGWFGYTTASRSAT